MTTARSIIKKSMQKVGILTKSESPSDDEANDALDSLNALISSWANDSLVIYARTWESFPLVGGTSTYTIGSGGDFNTVRPMDIISTYVRVSNIDYDIAIIDDELYNTITLKNIQGIPEWLNFDNAFPLANIRLYPVPAAAYSLFLLSEKQITSIATLDTELDLPNGFERALVYNLAIELAPEYQQQPDPSVIGIAKEALGLIRTNVAKVRGMDAYPDGIRGGNVYNGWTR